jgi:hypothetical protein
VLRFFSEAPDEIFLLVKIVLVMGIAGGCRVGELVNMKIDDVDDRGNVLVVTLPDTKTNKPRMFTIIINEVAINAVDIYRKYVILRPQVVTYRRFFLNYQRGKCTVQPVGENKILVPKMPSVIAEFLGLSEPALYTGQIYIARNFFLQSNTRVCRSKLPSGWRPRVIFLLQTLVCEDCSTKFPAIYLSLGILYRVSQNSRIKFTVRFPW